MKVLLWIALIIPNLVMELAAWIVAPILGLLVNDAGRLPRWLCAFETGDNTAFGDPDHARRWANRSLYARFVTWFWRNPAYTFSNRVLGARISGPIRVNGNLWVSDRPLVEGWCLRRTDDGYWHLYVVRCWALGFCLRMNLGWKLAGGPGAPNVGQYVCTVHPFLLRSPTRSTSPVMKGIGERSSLTISSPGRQGRDARDEVSGEANGQ